VFSVVSSTSGRSTVAGAEKYFNKTVRNVTRQNWVAKDKNRGD